MAFRPKNKKSKSKKKLSGFPSDAAILDFVTNTKGKVGKNTIARHFKLTGDHRITLKETLRRLRDEGKISNQRKNMATQDELPRVCVLKVVGLDDEGEVQAVPSRWEEAEQGPPPLILLTQQIRRGQKSDTKPPASGDLVLARPSRITDDLYAYKAVVMKRLEKADDQLLGVVRKTEKGLRLTPTDKKARYEYDIAKGHDAGAKPGELVHYAMSRERSLGNRSVRILKRLGSVKDQANISLIALTEHGIRTDMPQKVLDETGHLVPFSATKAPNHKDLKHVELITIDPPDARDHDDAIWASSDDAPDNQGGYKIIVAIADVAYYVKPASALDKEAQTRGNSTYLPDQVVPMLPERLSNELCSLKENVDRPALACFMTFDKTGKKLDHHFDRIIMRSAAKLSYQQAQDAINGNPDETAGPILKTILKPLWAAYAVLKKGRDKRQPLELELPERKLLIGNDGLISNVRVAERFDAHKLVEEFMIQANVAAAESLEKHKTPLIYRVHDAPSIEKLVTLADFLKTLGLSAPKGQVMKPANFNTILKKVAGGEYEHVVNQVVLRSQAQAVYTPQNLGHFGLNLRRYAHFTSPIRRYADLTVHRGLISAYNLGPDGMTNEQQSRLEDIADEISKSERRSMLAERATKDRMIAMFLSSAVRQTFQGRISGVARAGLFIMLDDSGADGFVPAAKLDGDYFIHDEAAHALVGERTGETFRIGDKVKVRLLEAVPVSGGMRFEMLSNGKKGKPAGRKKRNFKHSRSPRRR